MTLGGSCWIIQFRRQTGNRYFTLMASQAPLIHEGVWNKLVHMLPDESLISAGVGLRARVFDACGK